MLIVATLFAGCGNNQPAETKATEITDVNIGDTSGSVENFTQETITASEISSEVTTSASASENETTMISVPENETISDITAEETHIITTEIATENIAEVTLGEPEINFSDLE